MFGNKQYKRPSDKIETLIGPNTKIHGDLEFVGGLVVEGEVHGSVAASDGGAAALTVTRNGVVRGDVAVPHMEIDGVVEGDVYATEYISLKEHARINGNVYYELLEMAVGAEVNGNLVHRSRASNEPAAVSGPQELSGGADVPSTSARASGNG